MCRNCPLPMPPNLGIEDFTNTPSLDGQGTASIQTINVTTFKRNILSVYLLRIVHTWLSCMFPQRRSGSLFHHAGQTSWHTTPSFVVRFLLPSSLYLPQKHISFLVVAVRRRRSSSQAKQPPSTTFPLTNSETTMNNTRYLVDPRSKHLKHFGGYD